MSAFSLQVSDHPETHDNKSFEVFMAAKFGKNLIVVGEKSTLDE